MMSIFEMVREFHRVFGHPSSDVLNSSFCETKIDAFDFRLKLNEEELNELIVAVNGFNSSYIDIYLLYKENEEYFLSADENDESDLIKKYSELLNVYTKYYYEIVDACSDLTYVLNGQLHYIGFNPDNICSNDSLTYIFKSSTEKYFDFENKTYCNLIVDYLSQSFSIMKHNSTNTSIVITLTIHMLSLVHNLSELMNFSLYNAVKCVHKSNMTKLCYSLEEVEKTIEKYNNLYEDTKDDKFKYPTSKIVDETKNIYMVCNMDPSKGQDCAKILKSINYKEPDFSSLCQ